MSNDNLNVQKLFSQAIDAYTDRHSQNVKQAPKDIQMLENIGIEKLLAQFNSSMQNGLTAQQAIKNGQKYGKNEYQKRKRKRFIKILLQALCNQLLIILMIAAIASIIMQYFAGKDKSIFWLSGVSIMVAVIVCVAVSTISNYKKQKQFDQLDEITESTYHIQILRDGKKQSIHRTQIVSGDLIFIANGIQIPADCIVIKAVNIVVNQSAITGQTNQIYKNTLPECIQQKMDINGPTPIMISGSSIVSGQGIMMAVVVGKNSKAGKNYQLIFQKQNKQNSNQNQDDSSNQTPLQRQLQKLTKIIGRFGVSAAIFIFIILVIRLLIDQLPKGHFIFKDHIQSFVQYIIIGITVIVVAIPQGLPLAVTLTLAYSMKAMYNDKILVRKLQSCQIMGAARYLCSDKTGTITQNVMNVRNIINMDIIPAQRYVKQQMHAQYYELIKNAIFHNTSAVAQPEKGPQTEIALIKLCRTLTGQNQQQVRKIILSTGQGYFKRLPFDSSRKRMTTGLTLKTNNNNNNTNKNTNNNRDRNILFMNGASQQILQACNAIHDMKNNKIVQLTQQLRNKLNRQLQNMARKGYRTVSVSYKQISTQLLQLNIDYNKNNRSKDVIQQIQKNGYVLLGIFCIQDPPRPQSKQAIQSCKKAGINVIMVTGDNKITAQNISQQVGIIQQGKGRIVQANDLMRQLQDKGLLKQEIADVDKQGKPISQQQQQTASQKMKKIVMETQQEQRLFQQILSDLVVIARSKPEHKYIIVDGINKLGHVVGVTGDGANDAPALMRADIGLAMGITGTQVSKNASDIIILDDNFNSIVRAVVWGRNVYISIRKFLQFQLTANMVAVVFVLISSSLLRQPALTSIQMLWLNLIMNSMAALALATQPPCAQQLLRQQPNSPDQRLITNTMLKHIIGNSIFQVSILLIILFLGPRFIPEFADQFDNIIGQDRQAKYFQGYSNTVTDGSYYTVPGQLRYIVYFQKYGVFSRHYTFIFNTFVFLQVFNFICCRRVKDQINVFSRIFSTKIFWIILVAIIGSQVIVITFAGKIFQIYKFNGLTIAQWAMCIGIGSLSLVVSLILRLLPFCKPDDSLYIKRQSLRTKKLKQKHGETQSEKNPYVKPVKKYSKLNPMDYVRRIRARRRARKQRKLAEKTAMNLR